MSTAGGLRSLGRDVVRSLRGHDLALYAAGVTFYATIGLVPLLLLAMFLAGQVAGESTVRMLADGLAGLLPDELGAQEAGRFLSSAGTSMSPLAALAAKPARLPAQPAAVRRRHRGPAAAARGAVGRRRAGAGLGVQCVEGAGRRSGQVVSGSYS